MTDAKRKADKKFLDSVKNIAVQLKKDDIIFLTLDDISKDKNTSYSKVVKAMIKYCIDNNIDISSYI